MLEHTLRDYVNQVKQNIANKLFTCKSRLTHALDCENAEVDAAFDSLGEVLTSTQTEIANHITQIQSIKDTPANQLGSLEYIYHPDHAGKPFLKPLALCTEVEQNMVGSQRLTITDLARAKIHPRQTWEFFNDEIDTLQFINASLESIKEALNGEGIENDHETLLDSLQKTLSPSQS